MPNIEGLSILKDNGATYVVEGDYTQDAME
jgi:hypothetical protein